MNIQRLLNILLLTLSLSTMLLTLVSYILYRVRQIPEFKTKSQNKIRLEGIFFYRFWPAATLKPVLTPEQSDEKKFFGFLPKTTTVFFALTFSITFLILLVQSFVGHSSSALHDLTAIAKTLPVATEMVKPAFLKSVMSHEYSFQASASDQNLEEWLSPNQQAILETLKKGLLGKKICVAHTTENDQLDPAFNSRVRNQWIGFFLRQQISFTLAKNLDCAAKASVLVLPDLKVLTDKQRRQLRKVSEKGVGIIATGAIGTKNGLLKDSSDYWSEEMFGVRFKQNSDSERFRPSLFLGSGPIEGFLPPGLLLEWPPYENSIQASSVSGIAPVVEADFKGAEISQSVRANYFASAQSRSVWLALDPDVGRTDRAAERFYRDVFLLASLNWSAQVPLLRVANWKNSQHSAVALSVDVEDQFKNIENLMTLFEKYKFPATLFLVSDLARENPGFLKLLSPNFTIASHSDDHSGFLGESLKQQFSRIQDSRLDLEALTARSVRGFRAPEEKFDGLTVNAAEQNHLDFFAGDARFSRWSPVWIADGHLLYAPRTLVDDFALIQKFKDGSMEEMAAFLIEDQKRVAAGGGMFFLNMHSNFFGQSKYAQVVQQFLQALNQPDVWKVSYEALYDWWKARDKIQTSIVVTGPGSYHIKIHNNNTVDLSDFDLVINLGLSKVAHLQVIPAESEKAVLREPSAQNPAADKLHIDKITAGETIELDLREFK